ncbi:MAG: hypothetical protein M3256_11705 [Actinomycetota bacterium]|nr:hypothetical protein [Actinomycetota bacterium]
MAGADAGQTALLFGGTFFLVFVVVGPALLSTLSVIEDFMRLSRVDTALLGGGITWHPDLSITGIQLPARLIEGDRYQRIVVRMQYKPLVTTYRGAISGFAELRMDPPLLPFVKFPFILKPDCPESKMVFELDSTPFRSAALGQLLAEQRLPATGEILCRLSLDIETPWELRTVPGNADKRRVTLELGTVKALMFNAERWAVRMANDGYLTILPNGLGFNPVLTSLSSPDVATNVVIASRRWYKERAQHEAAFLLEIAARLLALQIVTEPDPEIVHPDDDEEAPAQDTAEALPDQQRARQQAICADLAVPNLLAALSQQTEQAVEEMRTDGVARAASETLRGARQTYVVCTQDLGDAQAERSDNAMPLTLIGLCGDAPGRHVLLSDDLRSPTEATESWPLTRLIDQRSARAIANGQRPYENFPSSLKVPPVAMGTDGQTDPTGSAPSWTTLTVDGLYALLESIESVLRAAHVVTRGFYIQPQPVTQSHWLDLTATSNAISKNGLQQSARDAMLATLHMLKVASKATDITVYNCCTEASNTSDHRLAALRDIPADCQGVRVVPVVYDSTGRWGGIEEPTGDSFVVSALSNDHEAFSALLDLVARHDRPTTFVPFFGPIEPTEASMGGLVASNTVHVLPLFVWDAGKSEYRSSMRSDHYRGMWTILRRHEGGHHVP